MFNSLFPHITANFSITVPAAIASYQHIVTILTCRWGIRIFNKNDNTIYILILILQLN